MYRVLVASLAAILISAVAVAKESNEQQIRDRAEEFAAAWNKHDPFAMAMVWSAEGDLINPFGRKARGIADIVKLLQDEHNTVMKQSSFKVTNVSVRFIEPTLAIVDEDVEISGITNPDGTPAPTLKPHVTTLMRKGGGKWWVLTARAWNYTPPPPPPPPAPAPAPK